MNLYSTQQLCKHDVNNKQDQDLSMCGSTIQGEITLVTFHKVHKFVTLSQLTNNQIQINIHAI